MEMIESHPVACAWVGGVFTAVVTLVLLAVGIKILMSPSARKAQFSATGFPDTAAAPLGLIALTCAALFAIPQTAVLGAILVTGFLGGAICTHFRLGTLASKPQ